MADDDNSRLIQLAGLGIGLIGLSRSSSGDTGDGTNGDNGATENPTARLSVNSDGLTVTATAADSQAAPGHTIEQYQFSFSDGTVIANEGPTVQHTFDNAGNYSVNVTVVDDIGKSGSTSRSVSVQVDNSAPNAQLTYSTDGLQVTATASGSSDPDNNIDHYYWTYGDGTDEITDGPTTQHTYPSNGTYELTVAVVDAEGAEDTAARTVTVEQPTGSAPSASLSVSKDQSSITATASASTDPDGDIDRYEWDFGDGNSTTTDGATVQHTYAENGTYTLTVNVVDSMGNRDTATRSVTISVDRQRPTINSFNAYQSEGPGGWGTAVDISASDNKDSSPEVTIRIYNGDTKLYDSPWFETSQVNGTVFGAPDETEASNGDTITVIATVRDNQGNTQTDSLSYTADFSDGGGSPQGYDHELELSANSRVSSGEMWLTMNTTGEIAIENAEGDDSAGETGDGWFATLTYSEESPTKVVRYNGNLTFLDWGGDMSLIAIKDNERTDPFELSDLGPRERWTAGSGSEVVEVTIYVSEEQYRHAGYAPAQKAAIWLSGALVRADISHDILWGLPPITLADNRTDVFSPYRGDDTCRADDCSSLSCCSVEDAMPSAFYQWDSHVNDYDLMQQFNQDFGTDYFLQGDTFVTRKDSNLLLPLSSGGGAAWKGGNIGAIGTDAVLSVSDYDPTPRPGEDHAEMWTIMHEFMHNMGYGHREADCSEATGYAENGSNSENLIDGYWYTTPAAPNLDHLPCTNQCGRLVSDKVDETNRWRPYFTNCSAELIRSNTGSESGNTVQSYSTAQGVTTNCEYCGGQTAHASPCSCDGGCSGGCGCK